MFRPENTQTITSGTATIISDGVGVVIVNPASVLASHTITLPASPKDRDYCHIFFGGTITGTSAVVTTFTISGGGIGVLGVLPTTANAGSIFQWVYLKATNKWYREL